MKSNNEQLITKLKEIVNDDSGRFNNEEKEWIKEAIVQIQNLNGQKINWEIIITILKAFGPAIYDVIKHLLQ